MGNPHFLRTRKKNLHNSILERRTLLVSKETIRRLMNEKRLNLFYERMDEIGIVPYEKWDNLKIKPAGFRKFAAPQDHAKGMKLEIQAPMHMIWELTEEFKENKMDKEEEFIH